MTCSTTPSGDAVLQPTPGLLLHTMPKQESPSFRETNS